MSDPVRSAPLGRSPSAPPPPRAGAPLLERPAVVVIELAVLTVLVLKLLGGGTELLALPVMGLLLWRRPAGPRDLGFHRPAPGWGHALGLAAVAAAVFQVLSQSALVPLLGAAFGPEPSGITDIEGDTPALVRLLILGVLVAPLIEEFIFRGYLLHRIEGLLRRGRTGTWAAATVVTVLFGLFHWYQGPVGVLATTVGGAVYLWVFLRTGRNLWAAMLCHALANLLAIIGFYLGVI